MSSPNSGEKKVLEDYALDKDEAIERAKKWREDDPFAKEIAPSLLSSNEIAKYAKKTAMLFPFDEADLKTASYSVGFGKFAYEFKDDGGYIETEVSSCKNGLLKLPANSIVFVQCATHFRLPKYMALRFNLRIKHVHRGLLLGTGPLVDPGFDGELLVPLHNLTSEDHYVEVNSHLIWIEFTKTTYKKPESTDDTDLVDFVDRKKNVEAKKYLDAARHSLFDGRFLPIQSSINGLIQRSIRIAKKAEKTAIWTRNGVFGFGITSVIAVVFSIIFFLGSFIQATYEQVDEVRHNLDIVVSNHLNKIDEIDKNSESLTTQYHVLDAKIDELRSKNIQTIAQVEMILLQLYDVSEKLDSLTQQRDITISAE